MIHDNFRKLIRRYWGANSGTSGNPLIYDYVDISGYVGTDADTGALYISYRTFANYNVNNYTLAQIHALGSGNLLYYIAIGNSTENEPNYNLGETLDNGLLFTTSSTKADALLCTTSITNTTSQDMTFNEVGMFYHIQGGKWHGVSSAAFDILLIKETLDAPAVLPANSTISITFNLLGTPSS